MIAASAYDRSGGGRRLAARLGAAGIEMSPSRWRLHQLGAATAMAAVAIGLGAPPSSWLLAVTVPRIGGRLVLRRLRDRRLHAVERAAPLLARLLAAELEAGAGAGVALTAARAAGRHAPDRTTRSLLAGACVRLELGETAGAALRGAACHECRHAPEAVAAGSPLDRVLAVFALAASRGGGRGGADLARLADALDDERQLTEEAAARSAEPRLVAGAIPALAAAVAVMLTVSGAAGSAILATEAGAAVLLIALLVAGAGLLTVRLLTAESAA